jgi:Zn2+/Cd2+-exporting ATPase
MKEGTANKHVSAKSPADHSIEQIAEHPQKKEPTQSLENESWVNNEWLMAIASFILLMIGLAMDFLIKPHWFTGIVRFIWYAVAYVPVGLPVVIKGIKLIFRGEVFTEFLLMSIATLGAFYIGEYPEGVAVMLFYAVGELFQGAAVNRAKRSIKALLDVRPDTASVLRDGRYVDVDPTDVQINETIQIKVGDRVPLDGKMLSEESSFNTAALTGESKPVSLEKGETVLAGMINEAKVVELQVTKLFNESSLARILTLVQNAQGRKAKTELFIRRFAKVYTPIVVFLAIGLTFIPYFFVDNYDFNQWLYRALIFLVISCPCALVVAIPLGYFGGIGAGSRNGILFKGSSYLDRMTRVDTVVMDKTGTLTKGVFKVQKVVSKGVSEADWLPLVASVEAQSTHPIGKAILAHTGNRNLLKVESLEEIKGHGLKGIINGKEILAGNVRLLEKFNIRVDDEVRQITDTIVVVGVDKKFAGYITISDELKEDAKTAIEQMHALNIKTVMLSGDKQTVVDKVARALNVDQAFGDLLPENKVEKVEAIKKGKEKALAFVGDGINDAPVLAISDVGIAMGGLGSDAAIETADVVIQTDQPSRIVTAINIGKATNAIVWQNIVLAFAVKLIVMALGAWGIASMWEAVFADVGVALLAILNAVRIQRMKF